MTNPILNLLLSRYDAGGGVQFAGNGMDDLKGLTGAYAAARQANGKPPAAPSGFGVSYANGAYSPPRPGTPWLPMDNKPATPAPSAMDPFTQAYAMGDQFKTEKPDQQPSQSPIDRIKAAFEQLKDMHQGPNQTVDNTMALAGQNNNVPLPLDNAQWPFGPVGAPGQAMAQAPHVPMPMARPTAADAAPQDDAGQPALMSFFQRNSAMMKDPITGEYLDPTNAHKASAQAGIFDRLFG